MNDPYAEPGSSITDPDPDEPTTDDDEDTSPPVVRFLVALARSYVTPDEVSRSAVLEAAHAVVGEVDQ